MIALANCLDDIPRQLLHLGVESCRLPLLLLQLTDQLFIDGADAADLFGGASCLLYQIVHGVVALCSQVVHLLREVTIVGVHFARLIQLLVGGVFDEVLELRLALLQDAQAHLAFAVVGAEELVHLLKDS